MARDSGPVFGRDEQWAEISAACGRGSGELLALHGKPGEGKTALLEAAAANSQRHGGHVLLADAADGDGRAAIDALLDGARQFLERGWDPQLLDAVAAAARRRSELDQQPQRALLPMVHELARALGVIAARAHTVIIIEDVDRCGPLLSVALCPLVQRLRAVGCAIVFSTRTHSFAASSTWQLISLADRVVELGPLADRDVTALLTRWCAAHGRAKLDQTVVEALRTALGPLFGNPGTLLSTLHDLRERGRLTVVDEHFCLSPLTEPVALPEQHALVQAVVEDGDDTERLASVLALQDRVRVDDLPMLTAAAAVGLEPSGQDLDRLVARGVLVVDVQDEVRFAVPALAATLRRRAGPERAWSLHAALARRMLAQLQRGGAVDRPTLAYHLVRTGPDFDSSLGAQVLIEEADRVPDTAPSWAATWYHAALRQLATDDERWPDLLRTLLRLRTSLGQYRELTEDIGLLAPAASGTGEALRERRTLLVTVGMCWLSALLHDERAHPEPAGMFAAFGGGSRFDAEIRRFSSALFDGRLDEAAALLNALFNLDSDEVGEPGGFIELGEVLLLLNAICGHHEDFQHAWSLWQRRCSTPVPAVADPERLREAGAMTDYATALELILGDDYGRPSRGSVLRYQEVLRAYLGGAWDTALSLARRMETELPAQRSAPARYLARAVAAEICSARGELRRASEWLHRSPRVMDGGHVSAWVRLGVRYQEGATGEALDEGWQDYLQYRDRGSPAGLERLLGRLVELAHREGRTEFAERALAELAELDAQLCSASSREQLLTAQARTYRSPEHAEQALALARRRGDLPARGGLFLLLADLTDDPADWLHEAYALAKQLGWHVARTTSQELMRARGVAPPRSRSRREPFSSTEIRIIDLVSDGCTNRQIAMAVQVSEKTVESHLTKLFARTGCRSRVELAAASLEGRLPAKSGS
ncbi:helix-turn-helix transcriptional regulator [Saccharopolyspora sp. HNM0986]|uniref:AAA family ATPase n=1 Tax=Saccharopolyspora galaxeae TaxID=2781241 RepID=UPI00190DBD48|nr:AAA family ATPase [Saccharopolyspora sp. HNM0986]MBK0865921.1 helix-turn-helix transcriptional regulator [Saccharopolyspora sp. HNM0986]